MGGMSVESGDTEVGRRPFAASGSTVRLTDIAAQAGVSEATVSRVLNGKSGVADTTRQSVFAALDVLGFERPRGVRKRSAGLVGLIVPELENPIFPAFAQVIERILTRRGYTPVLCTQSPGGATEDEYTEMLVERAVSGIIFISGLHADTTAGHERYNHLISRGIPLVLINGYAADVEAPSFSTDDRTAIRLAVTHLADLGHRKMGLAVGQSRFIPAARKLEAFEATVRKAAEGCEPFAASSIYSVEGGHAAAAKLLDEGCTALVCGSDLMALGAIRAVRERGLTTPGDVSIVGFGDSPLIAFTDPPLTTIREPVQAIGQEAVRALLDEISNQPAPRGEFLFAPDLVVRGSTGAARG